MSKFKLKDLQPAKAWASVSKDEPPQIWQVEWHRQHLQDNLRHIRVMITPVLRKTTKRKLSHR